MVESANTGNVLFSDEEEIDSSCKLVISMKISCYQSLRLGVMGI